MQQDHTIAVVRRKVGVRLRLPNTAYNEVFTGVGRRGRWSAEEKAAIIAESYGAGETVCGVARRHGLTPQQLFTWRRLARHSAAGPAPMFVPAVAWRPRDRNRRRWR